jgi:hypothetical protein
MYMLLTHDFGFIYSGFNSKFSEVDSTQHESRISLTCLIPFTVDPLRTEVVIWDKWWSHARQCTSLVHHQPHSCPVLFLCALGSPFSTGWSWDAWRRMYGRLVGLEWNRKWKGREFLIVIIIQLSLSAEIRIRKESFDDKEGWGRRGRSPSLSLSPHTPYHVPISISM